MFTVSGTIVDQNGWRGVYLFFGGKIETSNQFCSIGLIKTNRAKLVRSSDSIVRWRKKSNSTYFTHNFPKPQLTTMPTLVDRHVVPSRGGGPIRRSQRHRRSLPHGDGPPLRRSTRHPPSTDAVEPVSADDDVDMPDDGLLAAASLLFGLGDALGGDGIAGGRCCSCRQHCSSRSSR